MKSFLAGFVNNWQILLTLFGIGAAGATLYGTSRSIAEVPHALQVHDSTQREVNRELLRIAKTELCIKISELRKDDWTRCVMPNDGP